MSATDIAVERLERRLARERAAREEAERIAERALRDLYAANQQLDRRVIERTAELEQARFQAARSDSARTEFLRILSREMRTPLNGVLGMVELLASRAASEQERLWIESASRSASALNELVTRLLLYVDLDRPQPGPPQQLDVDSLVRETARTWERTALGVGQLLVVELRSDPEVISYGYPQLVRALLDELLGNVVEHGDPGPLRLTLHSERGRNTIVIVDSGPGFEGADRLLAVEEISSPGDGLRGIGYSVVSKIAGRTAALVEIDSAPGQSTEVRVQLAQAASEFSESTGAIR
ncbi:MAG: HAMP domain-containing histidine kinase [Acidimicrobiia bacterium]|nr:HAMP domain-containing histidine kinase [Acidimicrobiia bacterium]